MKLKKIKQSVLRLAGHFLLFNVVNVLCGTLRIEYGNKEAVEEFERTGGHYVAAFWHGTMILPWYLFRKKGTVALISKSKDGDLLARLLKHWDYNVVRGSSSEGGDVALGIMVDYAKNESSIAVTPDGPRGPARKLKAGAVITSKKSGLPLTLVGIGFQKKRKLKSWDNFEIPLPFSKAKVIYSEPITVRKDLSYEETSQIIADCELKLNEIQDEASRF